MKNVKLTNKRAGTVKLPGGRRIKKGQTLVVPVTALMHRSVRRLISTGRMQVNSVAKRVEQKTDSMIHAARNLVDDMIDSPALEEVSDKVLDAVESVVEDAVDSAIDSASNVVGEAIDLVSDLLGISGDDGNESEVAEESEESESEKPRRRSRRKTSDS